VFSCNMSSKPCHQTVSSHTEIDLAVSPCTSE
jgi:hypothetical protein